MKKLREEKGMMEIGAILVLIVIMSMGIAVYNTASIKRTDIGKTANALEMQSFNSQFTAFSGTNISASQVRTLISAVISSNATNDNHKITVITSASTGLPADALFTNGTSDASDMAKINKELKSVTKYSIELNYDNNGFIDEIVIK